MLDVGSQGDRLVQDFFIPEDSVADRTELEEHFRKCFVYPPPAAFKSLVDSIRPKDGERTLITFDGHPRTGKSWLALSAVSALLDEPGMLGATWWTSGIDSLRVYADENSSIEDGFERVVEILHNLPGEQLQKLRFVLLDDFLGTNTLRPSRWRTPNELRRFLVWNDENPFVKLIPPGCSVVLTGRSFFFLLVETLFDVNLRPESDVSAGAGWLLRNARWGVFLQGMRGPVSGGFDRPTLKEVASANLLHHPYREHPDSKWLYLTAPLVALGSEKPVEKVEEQASAQALFEEDLDTLSNVIKECQHPDAFPEDRLTERERVIGELQTAYFMAVLPALVFVGPDAYEAFGIDPSLWRKFARSMYYYDQRNSVARLPNPFYVVALNQHLLRHFEFAVQCSFEALAKQAMTVGQATKDTPVHGFYLRGFLERAMQLDRTSETHDVLNHQGTLLAVKALLNVPCAKKALSEYLEHQRGKREDDHLLLLELTGLRAPGYAECLVSDFPTTPGVAAAVAWAMARFFSGKPHQTLAQDVESWFEKCVRTLLDTEVGDMDLFCMADASPKSCWHDLAALFSTYLQWSLQTAEADERERRVKGILKLLDNLPARPGNQLLYLIFFDEVAWAALEQAIELPDIAIEFFIKRLQARTPKGTDSPESSLFVTNQFFTLAWHNKWMAGEQTVYASNPLISEGVPGTLRRGRWTRLHELASAHQRRFGEWAEAQIRQHGRLLDTNLQYHWLHFVTQRAVWMRDWCLHEDPLGYEVASRITEGSPNPKHNQVLARIAKIIIEQGSPSAIRNVFLMIGTRRDRMDDDDVAELISLLEKNCEAKPSLRTSILEGVFELTRQGFFEITAVGQLECTPCENRFRLFCLSQFDSDENVANAWAEYRDRVRKLTYLSDLQPKRDGWADIRATIRLYCAEGRQS